MFWVDFLGGGWGEDELFWVFTGEGEREGERKKRGEIIGMSLTWLMDCVWCRTRPKTNAWAPVAKVRE